MEPKLAESLDILYKEHKLNKQLVLWGIGAQTKELIEKLRQFGSSIHICMIVDNFKYTFLKEYMGIPVREPKSLSTMEKEQVTVLLAVNWADAIWKQLSAYGISEAINLYNLEERLPERECNLPYHFIDRKRNRKTLCYILAGYEPILWDNTLARVEAFQSDEVDYCLVSSGKYEKYLDELAEKNHWSYLYTDQNQVCYIQNLVIELHPQAEYIIKMDEDIFIGKGFFGRMLREFRRIEQEGDHRIGFAVPVIPLNCCGYVSYLQLKQNSDKEVQFPIGAGESRDNQSDLPMAGHGIGLSCLWGGNRTNTGTE